MRAIAGKSASPNQDESLLKVAFVLEKHATHLVEHVDRIRQIREAAGQ